MNEPHENNIEPEASHKNIHAKWFPFYKAQKQNKKKQKQSTMVLEQLAFYMRKNKVGPLASHRMHRLTQNESVT